MLWSYGHSYNLTFHRNCKALNRDRIDDFSNILPPVIVNSDLWPLTLNTFICTSRQCTACQQSRSKVQKSFYCPDTQLNTQTHTHRTGCCIWTTKVVDNNNNKHVVHVLDCKTKSPKPVLSRLSAGMHYERLKQETQLSLRDRATRACQLKSGKVLHKCRRLVFEKLWN